jgi:fructosamine-3-kinase
VLLHGDLWRGNILFDENGMAVLIDPACYFGWSEAEIAMTQLFGGFPEAFYHGYTEINPLKPGWKNRLRLYNLFHLLNHLNLFGSSYYASIIKTVRAFI